MEKADPEFKVDDRQKSSVDSLQKLYATIVAFAFAQGALRFVDTLNWAAWSVKDTSQCILFVAFASTIVPFYHGMDRHLYDTHIKRIDGDGRFIAKPSPMLLDAFVFLIEGLLLVAMGRSLHDPAYFLLLWSALILVDVAWTTFVWKFQGSANPIWLWNNLRWLTVAWAFYLALYAIKRVSGDAEWFIVIKAFFVATAEVCRSIFDYRAHWNYYFPPDQNRNS